MRAEQGLESSEALAQTTVLFCLCYSYKAPHSFIQPLNTCSLGTSAVPDTGTAANGKMRKPDPGPWGLNLTQSKFKNL